MKIFTKTQTGVVAEFEGKYWGVQYADGSVTSYGFGDIEKAEVSNPEFCKTPTDKARTNLQQEELYKARLVAIEVTTQYRVME